MNNPGRPVPGAHSDGSSLFGEPSQSRKPLPSKFDHHGTGQLAPTEVPVGASEGARGQSGGYHTTTQGAGVVHTAHSLKAGRRGLTRALARAEGGNVNGFDTDFRRRDLADALVASHFHFGELGVQVLAGMDGGMFEGINRLDPTKFVSDELGPVQLPGRRTLTVTPKNCCAEGEQLAFRWGHLVPGIHATSDPLLWASLFAYLDTQIGRLGGPNIGRIPIDRPHAPIDDMLRVGMHQNASYVRVSHRKFNTLDGRRPFQTSVDPRAVIDVAHVVQAVVEEWGRPATLSDHFSQPAVCYRSLTETEQDHMASAYAFVLGGCYEQTICERQLTALATMDAEFCRKLELELGLPAPAATERPAEQKPSPAVLQPGQNWPADGRVAGNMTDSGSGPGQVLNRLCSAAAPRPAQWSLTSSCWLRAKMAMPASAGCCSRPGRPPGCSTPCQGALCDRVKSGERAARTRQRITLRGRREP